MLEKHIQRHGLNGRKEKTADEEKFLEQDSKPERCVHVDSHKSNDASARMLIKERPCFVMQSVRPSLPFPAFPKIVYTCKI